MARKDRQEKQLEENENPAYCMEMYDIRNTPLYRSSVFVKESLKLAGWIVLACLIGFDRLLIIYFFVRGAMILVYGIVRLSEIGNGG